MLSSQMQLVQHLKYFQSLGFQSAAGLGFNILCDQSFTERLNIGILILRSILVMYRKAHSNTLLLSEGGDWLCWRDPGEIRGGAAGSELEHDVLWHYIRRVPLLLTAMVDQIPWLAASQYCDLKLLWVSVRVFASDYHRAGQSHHTVNHFPQLQLTSEMSSC